MKRQVFLTSSTHPPLREVTLPHISDDEETRDDLGQTLVTV
jgi:hypothetical protein